MVVSRHEHTLSSKRAGGISKSTPACRLLGPRAVHIGVASRSHVIERLKADDATLTVPRHAMSRRGLS